MKRKSAQFQKTISGKAKVSNDNLQLIKNPQYFNENQSSLSIKKSSLMESTPGSTRSKQESSVVSSKSKKNSEPQPAQGLSLLLSQDIENDIPDDQYNEILKEISKNLNFDIPKKPIKKTTTIKDYHQNKYEKYSSFQFDHSLHKEISIELLIDLSSTNQKKHSNEYYKEISDEIKTELMSKGKFTYYEFSNVQNISMTNYSQIDYVNYEHLYQKKQIMNQKTKGDIKEINLLTSLSTVYQQFLQKKESSFYFITPMHSFLFCNLTPYMDEGGRNKSEFDTSLSPFLLNQKGLVAILSNTLLLDKQLESNRISFTKITPNKKATDEDPDESDINFLDKDKFNNNPAVIRGYYLTIFYNLMINEYNKKTFNILSPFPFEGSTYRQAKIKVDAYFKGGKNIYAICINVFGCIFESELRDIIHLLSKKNSTTKLSKTAYTYSMKLERISNNCEFFALNQNLSHSIERVEYKDDAYYIK